MKNNPTQLVRFDLKSLLKLYLVSFLISLAVLVFLLQWSPWVFILFPDAFCCSIPFTLIPFLGLSGILAGLEFERKYKPYLVIVLLLISVVANVWIIIKVASFMAEAGIFD